MTSSKSICECPQCGKDYVIPTEHFGRRVKCAKCQNVFRVEVAAEMADTEPAVSALPVASQSFAQSSADSLPPIAAPRPIPGHVRCDFCHEYIPAAQRWQHQQLHLGSQSDGQQVSYMTLPPEERFRGSLDQVPKAYMHVRCRGVTLMPEDIIRTYLINPYFYGASSFCTGCGQHVRQSELVWQETGESLATYFRSLKRTVPNAKFYRNKAIRGLLTPAAIAGGVIGLVCAFVALLISGWSTALLTLLIASSLACAAIFGWFLQMRGGL
jgi:hypothetical protein